MKTFISLFYFCVLLSWMALAPGTTAAAAQMPQFTPNIGGGFTRTQPALSAAIGDPVFGNKTYSVLARTADNVWLMLDTPRAAGWLLAQYGSVNGDLNSAPVYTNIIKQYRANGLRTSPYVSGITATAKKMYRTKAANKKPNAFAVIGDCNSVPEAYVGRVSMGLYDVSYSGQLGYAADQFASSFARNSQAAFRGFNSASMFDPVWANPNFCQPGEGVLPCELRRSQASIAFVALGTGDQFTWKDFEKNYRGILDYLIKRSVLPVLITKADDLESQQGGAPPGTINAIIRKLGNAYGLPVIDFYAATRSLPKFGMRDEGNENFHMSAAGSDTRVFLTLQVLDSITQQK